MPSVNRELPTAARWFHLGKEVQIEVLELEPDDPSSWWIKVDDVEYGKLEELQKQMTEFYPTKKVQKDYRLA